MPPRTLPALAAAFIAFTCNAHALTISEILPENEGGLQDADLASPGWIEIHNESAAAVDLAGWRLTDDPLALNKWTFPAQSLAAGARLVVFASGKNRAVGGAELHTNFQLDPDGEYLALVAPDGVTKASEFNPFPKLRRNVSWAYAAAAPVTTPVLAEGASLKYHVPADGALGTTWTAAGFEDSAWSTGATGMGFDTAVPAARIDIKTPSFATLPPPVGWTGFNFTGIPDSGTGTGTTATVTVGSITVKLDAIGTTLTARNRSGTADDCLANAASLNNIAEDFVFSSTSSYLAGTPRGMNVTVSGLAASTAYSVTLYGYDAASNAARSALWTNPTSGASGTLTFDGASNQLTDDAAWLTRSVTLAAQTNASGQLILEGRAAATGHATSHNVFLSALQVGNPSYASLIVTDTGAQMQGTAKGLYTRAAFNVASPANYNAARLRVRYDDGFFAYLNGTLIASRNAPASPAWDASAAADRAKADGMTQELVDAVIPPGLLVAGTNVLAIHGLTQGAADTDFLLSPSLELLGTLPPGGVFYATPTPGAVNSSAFQGLVRDTAFSVDRHYVTTATSTAITCPTAGAQIHYTLDGSAPTASTGTIYTTPVAIPANANTILRAAAFVPGWIPSNADTQSYLSMSAIAAQPASPAGWPATWGTNSQVDTNDGPAATGTVPGNYAMDQRVVNNTAPGYSINDALMDVPTFSLVMAPSDFLGTSGIYQNPTSRGEAWERDASLELIDPSGGENGFAEQVRVEIHGNSSRTPYRMQKHSFRISFKGGTGSAASRLRYKFFPDSRQDNFDKLLLRATFTDGWGLVSWNSNRYRPDDSTMTRDIWVRRSWSDMGYLAGKSRYLHVVVNGLYWGVFDACEFMGADFAAANLGGLSTDWHFWDLGTDYIDPDAGVTNPFEAMFNSVTSLAAATLPADIEIHYQAILQYLDPANFADYYLLHQYAEAEDWPHHNGNACMHRTLPGAKIQWVPWDQEIALQQTGATNGHNIDRISSGATNTTTARSPGVLWNALRKVPAWRLLVADRAHALFDNNGPLSQGRSIARWQAIAAELDKPIVAESARWGDTATETPYGGDDLVSLGGGSPAELLARKRSRAGVPLKDPYLRDPDWTGAINYVSNTWIPDLHNRTQTFAIITRLRNQSPTFWPATEPPDFAQHGGIVASGYDLGITTPTAGAAIYYTLDGSDPRTAGTGTAAGTLYSGAVDLAATATVKARAVTGTPGSGTEVWSALTSATFIVGTAASASNLVISEVCYNPPLAGAWEFIELENISAGPIDLTNVQFTAGISYTFAPGTLLAAGQRLVLARDAAAFAAKFPGVTLHGTFTGGLDNSGEQIALVDALGADVRRFTYGDDHPWPNAADGNGHSMVLVAPQTNPDHSLPENWRASVLPYGNPGSSDALPFTGDPNADDNGDGYSNLFNYAMADPPANVTPGTFGAQFLLRAGADAARVIIETSTALTGWTPAPPEILSVSAPVAGIVTVTCTPVPGEQRTFIRARVLTR